MTNHLIPLTVKDVGEEIVSIVFAKTWEELIGKKIWDLEIMSIDGKEFKVE